MKITGVSFIDNGTYEKIKILDDSVIVSGKKLKDTIKTGKRFTEATRGFDDKFKKEEIIKRFISDNRINYLSEDYSYHNPYYDFQIGASNEKELLLKRFPSQEARDAILIKYLSDRYEYLLNSFDDIDEITLKMCSCSFYSEPGTFRLASKYINLYKIELDFIDYLLDILDDGKEVSIVTNTHPGLIQDNTDSFSIIGLKKKLKIDNLYNERNYIRLGNNSILNKVKEIINEKNNNLNNVKKLQLKMEEFK